MPAPFDRLKPFGFAGIEFPYTSYSVQGGIRKHKHEYSHNPGAAVEKLGRELYEIHVSVNFTEGLIAKNYQNQISHLGTLRTIFEQQLTASLLIPHIGTIQACAEKWTESARNTNRSTIQAELTFYEDLNSALQIQDVVTVSSAVLPSLANKFRIAKDQLRPEPLQTSFSIPAIGPNAISIWDAIADLSVAIAGIQDQQELFGALVSSKIDGLIALCRQADSSRQLNDPANYLVLDALHALWLAAIQLQEDLQNTGVRAQLYVTPQRMGIADVSVAIYGDSLQAAQLMQLNDCGGDPLDMPAGTQIVFYPDLRSAA